MVPQKNQTQQEVQGEMMFNTGSQSTPADNNKGASDDGAPSIIRELARYRAGLNYRRGYLDALRTYGPEIPEKVREERADEAARYYLDCYFSSK